MEKLVKKFDVAAENPRTAILLASGHFVEFSSLILLFTKKDIHKALLSRVQLASKCRGVKIKDLELSNHGRYRRMVAIKFSFSYPELPYLLSTSNLIPLVQKIILRNQIDLYDGHSIIFLCGFREDSKAQRGYFYA